MSAGFPVQTGTRFSASTGARAPAPGKVHSPSCPAARGPADPAPPRRQGACPERQDSRSQPGSRHQCAPSERARPLPPFTAGRPWLSLQAPAACGFTNACLFRPMPGCALQCEGHNPRGCGGWRPRAARLHPTAWPEGLRECEGGAAAARSRRASPGPGAGCERSAFPGTRSTRSDPSQDAGPERTRGSGLSEQRRPGQRSGLSSSPPGSVKSEVENSRGAQPSSSSPAPQPGQRVGEVRREGKRAAGRPGPRLLRLPLRRVPRAPSSISLF